MRLGHESIFLTIRPAVCVGEESRAYYSSLLQLIPFPVQTQTQWRVSSHPGSVTRDIRCEIFSQNVTIFLSRGGNLRKTASNGASDHKSQAESTEMAARGEQLTFWTQSRHTLNTELYCTPIKLFWLCQVAKRLRVFEYNLILIHFILTIPEIQF